MFPTRFRNLTVGRAVAGALVAALVFAGCQGDSTASSRDVDLTIAKSHTGDFTQGGTGNYSIVVSNDGSDASSGTVTVTDVLPTGLTFNAATGAGWTCGESPAGTMTCTRSAAIAAGGNAPAITLTVNVGAAAVPSVTNSATVSGGSDVDGSNNSDADATTVTGLAIDLTIAKTHAGNFTEGTPASYTITVSNEGNGPSTGTITVTDALPAGETFNAAIGTGWTCEESPIKVMSCTSSAAIAAAGNATAITLTVDLDDAAVPEVTNTAIVSGGGDLNAANNSDDDLATVIALVPDLTIAAIHSGDFTQGGTGVYTITVTNAGIAPSNGTITVTDPLPTGLTFSTATGTGWTCAETPAATMTCTSATAIAAAASAPDITLTVTVSAAAVPSVTNTVTVAGGGDGNAANNSSSDPTIVNSPATDHFIGVVAGNDGLTRGRVAFDILEDSSAATGAYNLNGTNHTFTSVIVDNGQVVATDGNLTFTGAITENDVTGDFSGGLLAGVFTTIPSPTPTGATAYCGAHVGYSNLGQPAGGVFAFVRRGTNVRGVITTINGRLHGFISSGTGSLVIDTVNATTALSVGNGHFTGSYSAVLGDNALVAGAVCPSAPPSPTLSQIAGVFGTSSPTTNNAFGGVAISLSSNGVGSSGAFTDSTGNHPFDQVISGPGNRVFLFTAGRPFIGTLTAGSLTGDTFDASDKNGLFAGVVRSTGVPVLQYCGTHAGSFSGGGNERGSFAFVQVGGTGLNGVYTSDNVGFSPGFVAGDAGNDAATMGGQTATVLTDALGFSGVYDFSGNGGPGGTLSGTLCP